MMTKLNISDAEWEVMHAVWDLAPVAAAPIVERLASSRGWRSRTTRTFIARLVRKGALRARREGNRFLYLPGIPKEQCLRIASQGFLSRVFAGEPASMLINLVQSTELTREQIRELKRILDQKEES